MRFSPLLRVLGTLLYGFIGYELGIALAGTIELTSATAPIIWSATLLGAVLGYLLSPWLVIAPARSARNIMRQLEIDDLIAGTIGLAFGLLIAALLAFPLSRLPEPFGPILPFVAVIIFGYLGVTVLVIRKDDFFALFRIGKRGDAEEVVVPPGKGSRPSVAPRPDRRPVAPPVTGQWIPECS